MREAQSWVGPYPIFKVNSALSYQVDTETRKKQVVHIQRLKRHEERRDSALVKRVTMVIEPDTKSDTMDSTCSELTVTGQLEV